MRKVQGVGLNDADYQTDITEWVGGKQKLIWRCPYHVKWKGMLRRCYSKDAYKTYKENKAEVCKEWLTFSVFRAWLQTFDIPEGKLGSYDLDKDILGAGNLYSPDTCALLPHKVNTFILDKAKTESPYPVGVYYNKSRFIARCNNPLTGKRESLGSYLCPEEAHQAWKSRKLQILDLLKVECELLDEVYNALIRKFS